MRLLPETGFEFTLPKALRAGGRGYRGYLMLNSETRIITADETMLAKGAEVLSEAFREEPLTAFICDFSKDSAPDILRRAYILSARIYFRSGQQIFLAVRGDAVKGVAVLTREGKLPVLKAAARDLPGILTLLPRVLSIISIKKVLSARNAVAVPGNLPRPFYALEAIAVDSRFRGAGIGGMLLDEVHRAGEENPEISGVYLITLTETNKLLYERRGYETVESRRLNGLNVYHMFMKNRAGYDPG